MRDRAKKKKKKKMRERVRRAINKAKKKKGAWRIQEKQRRCVFLRIRQPE